MRPSWSTICTEKQQQQQTILREVARCLGRGAERLAVAMVQDQVWGFQEKAVATRSQPSDTSCPPQLWGPAQMIDAWPKNKDKKKVLPSFCLLSLTPQGHQAGESRGARNLPKSEKPVCMSNLTHVRSTPFHPPGTT